MIAEGVEQLAHDLKTKCGTIKHDVTKLVGCYNFVFALNEFGTTLEDVLSKALQVYKLKHPKNVSFVFLYCWLLLKEAL
jgi:hypothetical protein